MTDTNTAQTGQPKNTSFIPLAREIPEHRQVKLAGQRRVGPIRNIAPVWSNINQPFPISAIDSQKKSAEATAVQPKSVTLELSQSPINEEITRLKDELIQKEQKLQQFEYDNSDQTANEARLQKDKDTADAIIKNLKQQLSNMTKNHEDNNKINDLQKMIDNKESESRELKDEIEELKQQLNQEEPLQKEISQYKKQIQELIQEQQRLHGLVLQENKKIEQLTEELKQKTIEQKDTQTKYQGMIEQAIQTPQSTQSPAVQAETRVVQARTIPTDANFPPLTQEKNAISGLVKDASGRLVENAIVIIKDKANHNLRALKSNQLGQFVATTSLPNGEYFVEIAKPNLTFDLFSIYLTGEVIPPLEIVSHESTA